MPVVLRYKGYTFFFFSNEGVPREPLHVHVRNGPATAKFWLEPDVIVADSYGMSAKELRELVRVARQNKDAFAKAWKDFFHE
ncbi:MAG: DUF4160 domain-containing protein [Massilia sp.]